MHDSMYPVIINGLDCNDDERKKGTRKSERHLSAFVAPHQEPPASRPKDPKHNGKSDKNICSNV